MAQLGFSPCLLQPTPTSSLTGTTALACFYPVPSIHILHSGQEDVERYIRSCAPLSLRIRPKFLTTVSRPSQVDHDLQQAFPQTNSTVLLPWLPPCSLTPSLRFEPWFFYWEFSPSRRSRSLFCFLWPLFKCKVLREHSPDHPAESRSPLTQFIA